MMMKRVASLFLLLILAGCSASPGVPEQKAQQGKISPERSLNMEQLCKDQAAHRYNSEVQWTTFQPSRSSSWAGGSTRLLKRM